MSASGFSGTDIGAGLSLLEVAGFVRSAQSLAKIHATLDSPDVAVLLRYTQRDLGEAARAVGMTEAQLARKLGVLRGAERTKLLEQIREALEPAGSGGRRGQKG